MTKIFDACGRETSIHALLWGSSKRPTQDQIDDVFLPQSDVERTRYPTEEEMITLDWLEAQDTDPLVYDQERIRPWVCSECKEVFTDMPKHKNEEGRLACPLCNGKLVVGGPSF